MKFLRFWLYSSFYFLLTSFFSGLVSAVFNSDILGLLFLLCGFFTSIYLAYNKVYNASKEQLSVASKPAVFETQSVEGLALEITPKRRAYNKKEQSDSDLEKASIALCKKAGRTAPKNLEVNL